MSRGSQYDCHTVLKPTGQQGEWGLRIMRMRASAVRHIWSKREFLSLWSHLLCFTSLKKATRLAERGRRSLQINFSIAPVRNRPPRGPGSPYYRDFTITLRHTTVGWTPLEEWSARCRDLNLTTHNIHNIYPCPRAGLEPATPACEWPRTHALDRAATGIG